MYTRPFPLVLACVAVLSLGCNSVEEVQLLAEDSLMGALSSGRGTAPSVRMLPAPCVGEECEPVLEAAARPGQTGCDVCQVRNRRLYTRIQPSFPAVFEASLTVRTEEETYVYSLGDAFDVPMGERHFIFEGLPAADTELVGVTLSLQTEALGTVYEDVLLPQEAAGASSARAPAPSLLPLPEPCVGAGCELAREPSARPAENPCDLCGLRARRVHARLEASFPGVLDASLSVRTETDLYVYALGNVFDGSGVARDVIFDALPVDASEVVSATLSLRTEAFGTVDEPLQPLVENE